MQVAQVMRAPRIPMQASVLIRRVGDSTWRRATTINISRTGVLLESDGLLLEPHTPVEVMVSLPVLGDLATNRILGVGRIVRTSRSSPDGRNPVMAAHLEQCRVLRHDEQPAYSLALE